MTFHIYLIRLSPSSDTVKVGISEQIEKREKAYGIDHILLKLVVVETEELYRFHENNLIKLYASKFKIAQGREYFKCVDNTMEVLFQNYFDNDIKPTFSFTFTVESGVVTIIEKVLGMSIIISQLPEYVKMLIEKKIITNENMFNILANKELLSLIMKRKKRYCSKALRKCKVYGKDDFVSTKLDEMTRYTKVNCTKLISILFRRNEKLITV